MDIRRPSPALVVASAALVVALFGSDIAQAASQVTTRQLADNAVTSSKVRNGSLVGADVRDRSLTGADVKDRSLRGADLAAGTVPRSRLASNAQTHAFVAEGDPNQLIGATGTTIVSVSLPAGLYVVSATTLLVNVTAASIYADCAIVGGPSSVQTRVIDNTGQRDHPTTLTAMTELTAAATVSLQCSTGTASTLYVSGGAAPSITAISVDTGVHSTSSSTMRPSPGARTGATAHSSR